MELSTAGMCRMKKIKSVAAFVLAIFMIFGGQILPPISKSGGGTGLGQMEAYAASTHTIDGLAWGFDADTQALTSIPYEWTGGTLPASIDGKQVLKIAKHAGYNRKKITKLVIPEGVTRIEEGGFSYCNGLTEMTIPTSMTYIGDYAFQHCDQLEKVNYLGKETDITFGYYPYYGDLWCHPDFSNPYKSGKYYRQLHQVTLSDTGNPSVDYPQDILHIGESQLEYHEGSSFADLDGLNLNGWDDYAEMNYFTGSPDEIWRAGIPADPPKYIYGGWCRNYCQWVLSMASVPSECSGITGGGDPVTWDETVYGGKADGYELKLGDGVNFRQGHWAIVTKAEVREGVTYITTLNGNHGGGVVYDTFKIKNEVAYDEDGEPYGPNLNSPNEGLVGIYPFDGSKCAGLTSYTISFDANGGNIPANFKSTKKIYNGAYLGLMPLPTKSGYAFDGWYTEAEGGKKLTSYRRYRYGRDMTLYAHWKEATSDGDEDNQEEQDGSVPNDYAGKMMTVDGVEGGQIKFDKSTGHITKADSTITKAVIPSVIDGVAVKAVADSAFFGIKTLSEVSLPEGLERIGTNAFQNNTSLERLALPSTLKSIGDYAFRRCRPLKQVTLGGRDFYPFIDYNGPVWIGYLAFEDCQFGHMDFSPSYEAGEYYQKLHEVVPTGNYIDDIFAIGLSQLGYHEGDNFDEMDGSHTKGTGDFAEMTYWYNDAGSMWCGEFAGWCMAMASVPEEIISRKYFAADENDWHEDWKESAYAGNAGGFTMRKGDVILFRYSGGNHIAMVESVTQNGDILSVATLNGNHTNDVSRNTYEIDVKTGKTTNVWTKSGGYVSRVYTYDFSDAGGVYYNLTFNANGGACPWTSKRVSYNASYGLMPLPEREGFVFDGWYTGAEGGTKVTSYLLNREKKDQTLYAHWVRPKDISQGNVTFSTDTKFYENGKLQKPDPSSVKSVLTLGESVLTRDRDYVITAVSDPADGLCGTKTVTVTVEGTKRYFGRLQGSLTYEILEKGTEPEADSAFFNFDKSTGTITKYIGADLAVVKIPAAIDGVPVTAIGEGAFRGNKQVSKVSFPDSVTSIGEAAFQGSALEEVEIPGSVTYIGDRAFYLCESMSELVLDEGIESIGQSAFEETAIESVTIPNSVVSISKWGFCVCHNLKTIYIGDGVKTIVKWAFSSNPVLESVTIGKGIETIEQGAFDNCGAFKTVTILRKEGEVTVESRAFPRRVAVVYDDGNGGVSEEDNPSPQDNDSDQGGNGTGQSSSGANQGGNGTGSKTKTLGSGTGTPASSEAAPAETGSVITSADKKAEYLVLDGGSVKYRRAASKTAKSIKVPATIYYNGKTYRVVQIADNAFKRNKKLTSITLGSNVRTIGKNAFSGCRNLKKITLNGNALKTVKKNALKGISKKAKITIKASSRKTYGKVVKMLKKAGGKKLSYKFKKSK